MAAKPAAIPIPAFAPTDIALEVDLLVSGVLEAVVLVAVGLVLELETLVAEVMLLVLPDSVELTIRKPGLEIESAVSERVVADGRNRNTQYCVAVNSAWGS